MRSGTRGRSCDGDRNAEMLSLIYELACGNDSFFASITSKGGVYARLPMPEQLLRSIGEHGIIESQLHRMSHIGKNEISEKL